MGLISFVLWLPSPVEKVPLYPHCVGAWVDPRAILDMG